MLLVQASPPSQAGQGRAIPQLSWIVPQRPLHQERSLTQTHCPLDMSHVRLDGQLSVQLRATPQVSTPDAQWLVQ